MSTACYESATMESANRGFVSSRLGEIEPCQVSVRR